MEIEFNSGRIHRSPFYLINAIRERRDLSNQLPVRLGEFSDSLDKNLKDFYPDLVIFDPFLLAYLPFFFRLKIPAIVVSTKPLATPDEGVPPYASYLLPGHTFKSRLLVKIAKAYFYLDYEKYRLAQKLVNRFGIYTHHQLLDKIGRHTGFIYAGTELNRSVLCDLHYEKIQEWVLWTPDMDFPRIKDIPENIKFVGPCIDMNRKEEVLAITDKEKYSSLVYVSVGTVFDGHRGDIFFLKKVITAFKNCPEIKVIIASGGEINTKELVNDAPNIEIFNYLPQLQTLAVANLAIIHGGSGTLKECIMKGVPVLVYPRGAEQKGVSARVVFHKIGLRGKRNKADAASIRQNALTILVDNSYLQNVQSLRDKVICFEAANPVESLFQKIISQGVITRDNVNV